MDKQKRKEKIAELRKHHEPTFKCLGLPGAYFSCKHAHYPDDMPEEKCIGLFASEIGKGDNVYLEFVTMDYTPSDSTRRLYVWRHQSDYVTRYKQNKKTGQYLIPVSELHVVSANTVEWTPEMHLEKGIDTTPLSMPIFNKKDTTEEHFKTEIWVGEDNVYHTVKFKNNIPYEYIQGTGNPLGAIRVIGEGLQAMIQFFKQLKY